MRERPILFSGPMVRAILAGRKTQTRRVVTVPWRGSRRALPYEPYWVDDDGQLFGCDECGDYYPAAECLNCPFGAPGDRLWVRETWAVGACADAFSPCELHDGTWLKDNGGLWFAADESAPSHPIAPRGKWRNPLLMPRWASRITLEVVAVRVKRLQEISRADAAAEGMCYLAEQKAPGLVPSNWPEQNFAAGWDTINGKRAPWASNPWVWVVEFKVTA